MSANLHPSTSAERTALEIRHQIGVHPDGSLFVREMFGDRPPMEWNVPDRATADALVIERRDLLLKMVADISPGANDAVMEARHIDYLKAGNA